MLAATTLQHRYTTQYVIRQQQLVRQEAAHASAGLDASQSLSCPQASSLATGQRFQPSPKAIHDWHTAIDALQVLSGERSMTRGSYHILSVSRMAVSRDIGTTGLHGQPLVIYHAPMLRLARQVTLRRLLKSGNNGGTWLSNFWGLSATVYEGPLGPG